MGKRRSKEEVKALSHQKIRKKNGSQEEENWWSVEWEGLTEAARSIGD